MMIEGKPMCLWVIKVVMVSNAHWIPLGPLRHVQNGSQIFLLEGP